MFVVINIDVVNTDKIHQNNTAWEGFKVFVHEIPHFVIILFS